MNRAGLRPTAGAKAADEWLTPVRFALLLFLLIAASFPDVLLGRATFVIRDFGLFSYPAAYFHRQCFWGGELPLWNPYSNCGLPFLAQWNTLALYPFSLIYLLLPLSWSLSFFCLAHQFWAGLGMYVLAYRWTGNRLAAGLAGVVFSFNGLTLNFLMWPSHVATFSWLPWVLWLGQRAWREGGKALVWGIAAGAMQMLAGGPETIVATWLVLLVLACGDWVHQKELRRRLVARFAAMGILVALVCAMQLLPFLELLVHSQRDPGYSSASQDWSMPFWGWANFLVPLFRTTPTAQGVFFPTGQYWTSSYYAGIGTVLLGAVAVRRLPDWRVRVLAALVLLGLVLALGDCTLLYSGLRLCLPGLGFVRYPVKFLILVLALAPLLAAFGLAALANGNRPSRRFEVIGTGLLLLLVAAIVAWELKSSPLQNACRATWQSGLSRAVFLILVVVLTAVVCASKGGWRMLSGALLLAAFWLDFATHTPRQNPGVKPSVYAPGWARAQLKLNPEPRLGSSRAMVSPAALKILRYNPTPNPEETFLRNRLAIRANCNLLDELPQMDGFFSLVPRDVFRLTALPYDHPDRPFPALLDFLGVSQVTAPGKTFEWVPRPSAMPLVTAGQQPVFADDRDVFDACSQTNLDLRQVVYLPLEARGAIFAERQPAVRARLAAFTNHKIALVTEAPATCMVVISQTHYPSMEGLRGWPACKNLARELRLPGRRGALRRTSGGVALQGQATAGWGYCVCVGAARVLESLALRQPLRENHFV